MYKIISGVVEQNLLWAILPWVTIRGKHVTMSYIFCRIAESNLACEKLRVRIRSLAAFSTSWHSSAVNWTSFLINSGSEGSKVTEQSSTTPPTSDIIASFTFQCTSGFFSIFSKTKWRLVRVCCSHSFSDSPAFSKRLLFKITRMKLENTSTAFCSNETTVNNMPCDVKSYDYNTLVTAWDCFIAPFIILSMWVQRPGKKPCNEEPNPLVGMQDNSTRVYNAESLFNLNR